MVISVKGLNTYNNFVLFIAIIEFDNIILMMLVFWCCSPDKQMHGYSMDNWFKWLFGCPLSDKLSMQGLKLNDILVICFGSQCNYHDWLLTKNWFCCWSEIIENKKDKKLMDQVVEGSGHCHVVELVTHGWWEMRSWTEFFMQHRSIQVC